MRKECAVTTSSRHQNRLTDLCTVFCLVLLVGMAPASFADGDREGVDLLIFGDSLSDTGNAAALGAGITLRPFEALIPSGPYATLRFTNGRTWVEHLAKKSARPTLPRRSFSFLTRAETMPSGAEGRDWSPGVSSCPNRLDSFSPPATAC
jgi:hypothetical protein